MLEATPSIMLALLGLAIFLYWSTSVPRRRYPPGPPARVVLGNIFSLPRHQAWIELTAYKKVYGDLIFFHGLGNHVLVLNSRKAISDLLEKRPLVYSNRPYFTVACELMGLGQGIPFLQYGQKWRIQRKLVQNALSTTAVKKYHSVQEDLAAILSKQLLDDPEHFFEHVRLTASRLILSITYGLSVKTVDSEYITHAEDTMHMVSQVAVPGAFMCDLFPWMKHLPSWLPFQRSARRGKAMIKKFVTKPFQHVQEDMANGVAPPSLTHDLLLASSGDESLNHHIKWSTGSLYGAAGETTYSTVLTCIMALALNPEKAKIAQQELDRVLGVDRLPSISDRIRLPYSNAIIKETMRWHPVLPLSLARSTAQDDVFEGYDIPMGTIVLPNVWAIALEERGPYSPHEFVPERFLEADEGDSAPTDPITWVFGFARRRDIHMFNSSRLCPGKHLAEDSVFIMISTILAAFDIAPPHDGELIPQFSGGLVSYPLPFKCVITPRSPSRAAQVNWRSSHCSV